MNRSLEKGNCLREILLVAAIENAQMEIGLKTIGVDSESFFPRPHLQIGVALIETTLEVAVATMGL